MPAERNKEEVLMKVSKAMTRNVRIANPEETIQTVARVMAALDAGLLPVADGDRVVGMITDRDIAVRGIVEGKGGSYQHGRYPGSPTARHRSRQAAGWHSVAR
jgi:predicted transcriptional regulator